MYLFVRRIDNKNLDLEYRTFVINILHINARISNLMQHFFNTISINDLRVTLIYF